jgi:hypothetical protein
MTKCLWCGHRTQASAGRCQSCKSKRFHALQRIKDEKLLLDQAGGGWWIWDAKGDVLVTGQPTREQAIFALAHGEELDE